MKQQLIFSQLSTKTLNKSKKLLNNVFKDFSTEDYLFLEASLDKEKQIYFETLHWLRCFF